MSSRQTFTGSGWAPDVVSTGHPASGTQAVRREPVQKWLLLLITLFLGWMGGHRFYQGKTWLGVLYLLFWWTLIPGAVSLIELVVYALTSAERLNEKYSVGLSGLRVLALAVVALAGIAALGIVTLRSFHDYKVRAYAGEGVIVANRLKAQIEASFLKDGPHDMSCETGKCQFEDMAGAASLYVRSFRSDRRGVITIEYAAGTIPPPRNKLAFSPQIDGKPADLSDPRNAGKAVTWQCGRDAATTLDDNHLPAACRRTP